MTSCPLTDILKKLVKFAIFIVTYGFSTWILVILDCPCLGDLRSRIHQSRNPHRGWDIYTFPPLHKDAGRQNVETSDGFAASQGILSSSVVLVFVAPPSDTNLPWFTVAYMCCSERILFQPHTLLLVNVFLSFFKQGVRNFIKQSTFKSM